MIAYSAKYSQNSIIWYMESTFFQSWKRNCGNNTIDKNYYFIL